MIQFHFSIRNPFDDNFKILFNKCHRVSKNKFLEYQIDRTSNLIEISFDIRFRQNHAGFGFTVGLLFFEFVFNFYDNRHWNDETNDYEIYEE